MTPLLESYLELFQCGAELDRASTLFRALPESLPEDWRLAAAALIPALFPGAGPQADAKLATPADTRLLGICGGQGSGKSTLARALVAAGNAAGLKSASLSLDDVYHTRATRAGLARSVHPLLATRGVPGTHDLALLKATLEVLGKPVVALPSFDKGLDDRCSRDAWRRCEGPLDLLVLEGWCLGVTAQPVEALAFPCNALERDEDADGIYRHFVNESIRRDYEPLWACLDAWLFLKVPSFDAVHRWRTQQEQALPAAQRMDPPALERFVAHYERLTTHLLATAPASATWTLTLNENHRVEFRVDSAPAP